MRYSVDGIMGIPHPEQAAKRPCRRTHSVDPAAQLPIGEDGLEAVAFPPRREMCHGSRHPDYAAGLLGTNIPDDAMLVM
jgi:hypothetical protein